MCDADEHADDWFVAITGHFEETPEEELRHDENMGNAPVSNENENRYRVSKESIDDAVVENKVVFRDTRLRNFQNELIALLERGGQAAAKEGERGIAVDLVAVIDCSPTGALYNEVYTALNGCNIPLYITVCTDNDREEDTWIENNQIENNWIQNNDEDEYACGPLQREALISDNKKQAEVIYEHLRERASNEGSIEVVVLHDGKSHGEQVFESCYELLTNREVPGGRINLISGAGDADEAKEKCKITGEDGRTEIERIDRGVLFNSETERLSVVYCGYWCTLQTCVSWFRNLESNLKPKLILSDGCDLKAVHGDNWEDASQNVSHVWEKPFANHEGDCKYDKIHQVRFRKSVKDRVIEQFGRVKRRINSNRTDNDEAESRNYYNYSIRNCKKPQ